jgi:hypothetical protein
VGGRSETRLLMNLLRLPATWYRALSLSSTSVKP